MQKLVFEPSWDKALSAKDREEINELFTNSNYQDNSVGVSPVWKAVNYRGELLLTVLVHNSTSSPLFFNGSRIQYKIGDEVLAEHEFSLPQLVVEPKTSMPWTFIFPVGTFEQAAVQTEGKLELDHP